MEEPEPRLGERERQLAVPRDGDQGWRGRARALREGFQLELPLKAVFEAPTVARFAVLVEEAIIAELEDLSEEEAMELL